MSEEMIKESHLLGIRFWAQWKPIGYIPLFEVYEYQGCFPNIGAYIFKNRKTGATVSKGLGQLNINGFLPFCLNLKTISEAMELRKI